MSNKILVFCTQVAAPQTYTPLETLFGGTNIAQWVSAFIPAESVQGQNVILVQAEIPHNACVFMPNTEYERRVPMMLFHEPFHIILRLFILNACDKVNIPTLIKRQLPIWCKILPVTLLHWRSVII